MAAASRLDGWVPPFSGAASGGACAPKKPARCHHSDAEPFRARQVPDVEGDDCVCAARNSEFEQKIIAGIAQKRTHAEVYGRLTARTNRKR